MSISQFDRGDLVELKATFRNDAGVVTDPTTTTFKIQPSGGTLATYVYGVGSELVRVSAGIFIVNWIVAAEGIHEYRFIGTGAVHQEQGSKFFGVPRNVG